jgi:hypothetical protein
MPAWDNVQLPPPPSLVPPKADFSALGELGTAYYQGQQLQRQQALANAFKEGLPTIESGPNAGQPDYRAMANRWLQLGGSPDQAMALIKQAGGQQLIDQSSQSDRDFQNAVKYGLGGQPAQPTQPVQPTRPVQAGGANAPVLDPNLPPEDQISPRQVAAANGPQAAPAPPSLQPQPVQPQPSVEPQPAQPQAGYPPSPSQIAAAAVHVPDTANPIFKQHPGVYADLLDKRADGIAKRIDAGKLFGLELKGQEEEAKSLRERAGKIRQELQPTTEQRNIQEKIPEQTIYQQEEAKRGGALYNSIQASARNFEEVRPYLDSMTSLFKQPNFYSGTGQALNLAFKRAYVALGGDPNTALPQEAIKKVLAKNILDQVGALNAERAAMGSAGGGRIFASQIKLMNDAAQNPDNSPAALRYLTELGYRTGQHIRDVQDLADRYNGGRLDNKFNPILAKYNREHPMFTPDELKDIRLVAPPEFSNPAQVTSSGLPKGSPFKTPDGRIKWVP